MRLCDCDSDIPKYRINNYKRHILVSHESATNKVARTQSISLLYFTARIYCASGLHFQFVYFSSFYVVSRFFFLFLFLISSSFIFSLHICFFHRTDSTLLVVWLLCYSRIQIIHTRVYESIRKCIYV